MSAWLADGYSIVRDENGEKRLVAKVEEAKHVPLLLAAPDMLEALRHLQSIVCFDHCKRDHGHDCRKATEAIRKAEARDAS